MNITVVSANEDGPSSENDSISIYSSFVCHFTALDIHTALRTVVLTFQWEWWGGEEGAAVDNKCLNWLREGAARIVKKKNYQQRTNGEPIIAQVGRKKWDTKTEHVKMSWT